MPPSLASCTVWGRGRGRRGWRRGSRREEEGRGRRRGWSCRREDGRRGEDGDGVVGVNERRVEIWKEGREKEGRGEKDQKKDGVVD